MSDDKGVAYYFVPPAAKTWFTAAFQPRTRPIEMKTERVDGGYRVTAGLDVNMDDIRNAAQEAVARGVIVLKEER